jgi:NTE family protein
MLGNHVSPANPSPEPEFSDEEEPPGLFDVMAGSINIMQDRITRARMAGDPPDVALAPRLAHLGLMDFDHAAEAMAAGMDCVQRHLPLLQDVLDLPETGG